VTFTAQGTAGPAAIVTPSGDGQQAAVNTAVATAPAVTVKDQFGNPIPGVQVQFAVAAGGGAVAGGSPTTDAAGTARVTSWTLGKTVGQNRLTATLAGLAPVPFTATAIAGPAAKLVAVSGDLQTDTVLAKLANPFVVRVTDQFDNPLAGIFVAYSVTAGGGSLTAISATSDAQGLTHATLVLGPAAGAQTVRAGLQTGSVPPATFTATATYPPFFATEVAPGGSHACARKAGAPGTVYCWGANPVGQLGNGTVLAAQVPTPVAGGIAFSGLVAGLDYTCGLDPIGRAYCWGGNGSGQLGDGTGFNRGSPTAVVGSFVYQKLFASDSTTCGLMVTGDLRCWGANSSGQLGDGSTTSSNAPVLVSGGLSFRTAALGRAHACAITTGGATYCWGDNTDGTLGTNSTTTSLVPVAVSLAPALVTIAAGAQHTCGATQPGVVYCWGKNPSGEMGAPPATTGSLIPLVSQFPAALAELVAAGHGTCGRTVGAGAAQCWGFNGDGQLDVPATATPYLAQPVQAAGSVTFGAVRLASKFGCGIGSDGAVYCWGANTGGQLGDGTTTASLVPVRVRSR
jgi:alpha-tubulin suppressor-like RCC1 family protein